MFAESVCVLTLRVEDSDDITRLGGDTVLSSRVMRKLNLNLDSEDTLLELNVTDGEVNVVVDSITGLDLFTRSRNRDKKHVSDELQASVGAFCLSVLQTMYPSRNFMALARAARSFPEMTTSTPLAPFSMT